MDSLQPAVSTAVSWPSPCLWQTYGQLGRTDLSARNFFISRLFYTTAVILPADYMGTILVLPRRKGIPLSNDFFSTVEKINNVSCGACLLLLGENIRGVPAQLAAGQGSLLSVGAQRPHPGPPLSSGPGLPHADLLPANQLRGLHSQPL